MNNETSDDTRDIYREKVEQDERRNEVGTSYLELTLLVRSSPLRPKKLDTWTPVSYDHAQLSPFLVKLLFNKCESSFLLLNIYQVDSWILKLLLSSLSLNFSCFGFVKAVRPPVEPDGLFAALLSTCLSIHPTAKKKRGWGRQRGFFLPFRPDVSTPLSLSVLFWRLLRTKVAWDFRQWCGNQVGCWRWVVLRSMLHVSSHHMVPSIFEKFSMAAIANTRLD